MLDAEDVHYGRAISDVCSAYPAFRPPRRVSVSQGAADILVIKQPGGTSGPWSPEETPYMIEPVDMLASRRHVAVIFAGPARTGKTMGLLDGWVAHAVVNDPGDFLVVQMTQEKAREFSKVRIDRAIRNSPKLQAMKSASAQDDNTHDKQFRNGMWLRIAWPTASNLSGSDYRYAGSTDYDRVPDDIDGEGALFPLMLKRTQTFLSRGMAMAESSPGRDVVDPNWEPVTPHEAPPVTGILGLYNQGDRRCWYWRCTDCGDWFWAKPGLSLFNLPDEQQLLETVREANIEELAAKYAYIACPHCAAIHGPEKKEIFNRNGRWVPDGMQVVGDGELVGKPLTSSYASYWLGGVSATFQSWRSLISKYLQGLREYALTGSELTLKTTVNTDQGMPYTPMHLREASRGKNQPIDRKDKALNRYIVPDWTRFIIATVDVQGGTNSRFVVQVQAIGKHREKAIIDRYNITESKREGMGGPAQIDPAAYPEDWDVLTERVLRSTYRTPIEGKELRVKLLVVDTGGEHLGKGNGVTDKAYAWYRRLRRVGEHRNVMLVKGSATPIAAGPIKETWVGHRGTREDGDVPLYMLDPNKLKDIAYQGLTRTEPGPGYVHLPDWLPKAWFDELQAEVRNEKGTWVQVRKRNEAFDLLAYCEAGYLRLGADKIVNWDKAPAWAAPLELNSELVTVEERREMKANEAVAPVPVPADPQRMRIARPTRRTSRSPYLR
jgi:phage terminase large subunit GpA-like protein